MSLIVHHRATTQPGTHVASVPGPRAVAHPGRCRAPDLVRVSCGSLTGPERTPIAAFADVSLQPHFPVRPVCLSAVSAHVDGHQRVGDRVQRPVWMRVLTPNSTSIRSPALSRDTGTPPDLPDAFGRGPPGRSDL